MKKFILFCCIVILLSCGADAQQIGIGGTSMIPTHGHLGSLDGGTLNNGGYMGFAANMLLSSGTPTVANINLVVRYDNLGGATGLTQYKPPLSGSYNLTGILTCQAVTTLTQITVVVRKNSSGGYTRGQGATLGAGGVLTLVTQETYTANGTTDYFDASISATGTGTLTCTLGLNSTWFGR